MPSITRVLIIHGYASSGPKHWQTWLARECEKAGLETHYPDLPDPYRPDLAIWLQALKKDMPKIDAQTALVGHSLGCAIIHHILQRKDVRRAGHVILVAPATPAKVAASKLAFLNPFYEDMELETTKKKAKKIDVFASDDDVWMSMNESAALARQLDATLHTFVDGGHLSLNAGYHTFPEVLDVLLSQD
ncbi:serine hydrolase family protein [Candidatus Micrarchaeota archaeon]|nr:serine hydrolase family protein [Candidatus Micrarchaeota archaeon]